MTALNKNNIIDILLNMNIERPVHLNSDGILFTASIVPGQDFCPGRRGQ